IPEQGGRRLDVVRRDGGGRGGRRGGAGRAHPRRGDAAGGGDAGRVRAVGLDLVPDRAEGQQRRDGAAGRGESDEQPVLGGLQGRVQRGQTLGGGEGGEAAPPRQLRHGGGRPRRQADLLPHAPVEAQPGAAGAAGAVRGVRGLVGAGT